MTHSELIAILNRNRIDYHGWFKTVEELLQEINDGESSIDNNGVNQLAIVNCEIVDSRGYRLLEAEQVYHDGRVNSRMIKVSGKIQRNEAPVQAMHRELAEELGIVLLPNELTYTGSSVRENQFRPFYATLPSRCIRHHFFFHMPTSMWKQEYVEVDSKKTAKFRWFPSE